MSVNQQRDWLQPRHFGFTVWIEAPNTNLTLPLVSVWVWYLSDYLTRIFNTEVCPVSLSNAFHRIVILPLPSPPSFSLHPSPQVKCPQQWKINSQVESVVMGIKAIRAGTAENESLTSLGVMLWHVVPLYHPYHPQHDCVTKAPKMQQVLHFRSCSKRVILRDESHVPALNKFYKCRVWGNSFNKQNKKCPAHWLGGAEW